MNDSITNKSIVPWALFCIVFCSVLFIAGGLWWINLLGIVDRDIGRNEEIGMLEGRFIAADFAKYANDHGGQYPSGKTSTEVFQKLYDSHYLESEESVFLPGPGKVKVAYENQRPLQLRSENVGWDVVMHSDGSPLTNRDPGDVPLLLPTGILGPITLADGPNSVILIASKDYFKGYGLDECFRDTTTRINGFSPLPDCLLNTSYKINLTPINFSAKGRKYMTIHP